MVIKCVVCDLEGKDENELQKREEDLRQAIKVIVPCDIIPRIHPLPKAMKGHTMSL